MAGDAALGITPVMKWNFERSCYRWLVTRHPAQFERMDFTAQILQSASRARKAFYECGWAEAKVLIRPSDGKFERTPFFDTIIRRGLRNSTRFDSSTLTEEEIEALGMHRDETLGFKLQIRQFRSTRKELPPQGRGGGAGRLRASNPNPASRPHNQPPLSIAHPTGGAVVRAETGAHGPSPARDSAPQRRPERHWVQEEGVRAVSAGGSWIEEAGWHHGAGRSGNTAADSSNGNGGDGSDKWAAWNNSRRWNAGVATTVAAAAATSNSEREHYGDAPGASAVSPPQQAPPLAWAKRSKTTDCGRNVWQGPPGRSWGLERRERTWESSSAGGGDRGDFERGRKAMGDGEGRDGVRGGGGGGPGRPQTEAELRASFCRHVDHIGRRPGALLAAPGRGSNSDGIVRGGSPESAEAGDGALLTQGYRRLAAMNERTDVREEMRGALPGVGSNAQRHCSLAQSAGGGDSCGSLISPMEAGSGGGHIQHPQAAGPCYPRIAMVNSPSRGDDSANSKKRCAEDGDISPGSRSSKHGSAKRGRSNSNERDVPVWVRGQTAATPPDTRSELLARELAESEKQLTLARNALDVAKARFDEASRAHLTKREQVLTAAGHSSLHSIARSSAKAAVICKEGTPKATNDMVGGEDDDKLKNSSRRSQERPPALRDNSRSSPVSSSTPVPDGADEMREVKREAALLCGIGRAPVSPAEPPARGSPTPSMKVDKGLEMVSLAAVATANAPAGKRNLPTPTSPDSAGSSRHVRPSESLPSSPSPLPNLAWAIPNGVHAGTDGCRGEDGVFQQQHHRSFPKRGGLHHSNGFPPPALAAHPVEAAAAAAARRRSALPPMAQVPGSPSASGETDSDHSDSTSGAGGTVDDPVSRHRVVSRREIKGGSSDFRGPAGVGRESWGGHSVRGPGFGGIAPLARLAAVCTTAGVHGGVGAVEGLRCA